MPHVTGDAAAFKDAVDREVHDLAALPFGIAMLHCIGYVASLLLKCDPDWLKALVLSGLTYHRGCAVMSDTKHHPW